jgi:death on curing protein
MNEIFFPNIDEILFIHQEIIKSTGGSAGLRDIGALESALHAAENRFHYETEDLTKLAATYAFHLSQAHAFIDGNKRIAAVVSELFLKLNGKKLNATNDEIIGIFLDIAAGNLSREEVEEKYAGWVK